MKNLKQYILEKLVLCHQQVDEKLIVNKNYKTYKYYPKTWKELRHIIEERYKELGPGTKNEPIDFNDIDVSRITTFYSEGNKGMGLFEHTKFEHIDISDWDVSKVENMNWMFCNCYKLKSIGDLSNWNVSKIRDIANMFKNCWLLDSIGDLSHWDISSVKDMCRMFKGCKKEIVPNWYKINHKKI